MLNIKNRLHTRQGVAITNYSDTLPQPQSDLAQDLVKSEYNFEFLGIGAETHERQVEQGLIDHIRRYLLELGAGFAFVGNQYHLNVSGEDVYTAMSGGIMRAAVTRCSARSCRCTRQLGSRRHRVVAGAYR